MLTNFLNYLYNLFHIFQILQILYLELTYYIILSFSVIKTVLLFDVLIIESIVCITSEIISTQLSAHNYCIIKQNSRLKLVLSESLLLLPVYLQPVSDAAG